MGPMGLVAIIAGWFTTEVGRQPWVVYGVQRTADAVSNHAALPLAISLGLFVVVYCTVFGVGIAYMLRLIRKGPVMHEGDTGLVGGPGHERQQMRPLSAATDEELNAAANRS
jgi:cytochrome d ubiquinol oxidase subunit I